MAYEWLAFSLILLAIWLAIFLAMPAARKRILWASLLTAPFGLTEPLFVPEYWNPMSLFDLARTTGFDIESIIFSFAFGGIGIILYSSIVHKREVKVNKEQIHKPRHRFHNLAVAFPVVVFLLLYFTTNINPIYTASISMLGGGIATLLCRPDLKKNVLAGGILFAGFYFVFFEVINLIFPYFVNVWNFSAISGIKILGVPLEEVTFGFTFGMMWSSVYEHIAWRKLIKV